MRYQFSLLYLLIVILSACGQNTSVPVPKEVIEKPETISLSSTQEQGNNNNIPIDIKSSIELKLEKIGLVDISEIDSSISVNLIYSTPNNFTKIILYDSLKRAYLLPHVAEMLSKAQANLHKSYPDYSLIIYDAARPVSVQRKMWDIVKGTPLNIYVSNPSKTGLHNYGAAVDVTIINKSGIPLDMGVPFDHFGKESHIDKEEGLIKTGELSRLQVDNRKLLREIMRSAGFKSLRTEWWHFNACTREEAKNKFKVINF